jgi:hypothetical protein
MMVKHAVSCSIEIADSTKIFVVFHQQAHLCGKFGGRILASEYHLQYVVEVTIRPMGEWTEMPNVKNFKIKQDAFNFQASAALSYYPLHNLTLRLGKKVLNQKSVIALFQSHKKNANAPSYMTKLNLLNLSSDTTYQSCKRTCK